MAPVTRRHTRAAQKTSQDPADVSSVASPSISAEEAPPSIATKRGNRKSTTQVEEIESPLGTTHEEKQTPIGTEATEVQEEVEDSTPTKTTSKNQKLAVRTRDDDGHKRLEIEVQLPSRRTTRSRSESVADSQDGETLGAGEVAGAPTPVSASKQLEEEASQRLSQDLAASQSEPGSEVEPQKKPTPSPAAAPAQKSKHVVFGDDDDVDNFVAAAAEAPKAPTKAESEDEGSDSDNDDEAPEAVSTQAAAKETLKSAQAFAEAAEKQAATLKRKRQERDDLFRQQAEKRKRAHKPVKSSKRSKHSAAVEDDSDGEKTAATGRRRVDKADLPDMLPARFLTDSESDSEDAEALRVVKPTKIKFDQALQTVGMENRAPKDQVVGSTVYRVLANDGDKTLAPKMKKNSRHVKEDLLRRKRVGVVPAPNRGFFKKR
ncbi:uncharacterized protein BCR38DRAFT_88495 [Pseudomassariella vexata]|uniref:U3 snoRNA associated-domain-containing protein n=1 Tax=Pseudomassariella vexata TaxID=1141098 RepID=A0A1Y2EE98_9PEZI|nr:uncharacterized protein BCR38DRAFT_88495 [Pseudomassariella vexata]ORY69586.1 hypothetical protein BCR38DRAFT_88495 [Pseudomassariella vexata]